MDVDDGDKTPEFYEITNVLKSVLEEKEGMAYDYSFMTYAVLLDTLCYISETQGTNTEQLQQKLESFFTTKTITTWIEGTGMGQREVKVLPTIDNKCTTLEEELAEIEKGLEELQVQRKAYYKAKEGGDAAQMANMKSGLDAKMIELEQLIDQLASTLEGFSVEEIMNDCENFINYFKSIITAVPSVTADLNPSANKWFSIDGRQLQAKPLNKGLYIVDGKKIMLR